MRAAIRTDGTVRQLNPGERIYAAGDGPSGFYGVLEGEVRLFHYASSGTYAFYYIHRPPSWFGILSELDAQQRFSDAVAWKPTRLLHVRHGVVQRLLAEDPGAYRDFTQMVCRDLRTTLKLVSDSRVVEPLSQTAQLLAHMAASIPGRRNAVLDATQEQLAAMVGVSRQTMNKILARMESGAVIRRAYGRIEVIDRRRLKFLGERIGE